MQRIFGLFCNQFTFFEQLSIFKCKIFAIYLRIMRIKLMKKLINSPTQQSGRSWSIMQKFKKKTRVFFLLKQQFQRSAGVVDVFDLCRTFCIKTWSCWHDCDIGIRVLQANLERWRENLCYICSYKYHVTPLYCFFRVALLFLRQIPYIHLSTPVLHKSTWRSIFDNAKYIYCKMELLIKLFDKGSQWTNI